MDPVLEPELSCEVIWADPDILEISVRVAYDGWVGHERAYVTREEMTGFAKQLDLVARGATEARLDAGQDDLSYARLTVFEYNKARRVGARVQLGRARGTMSPGPSHESDFKLSVPLERGQLSAFAGALRRIIRDERGVAELRLPNQWE